ncbi:unnamed protein product [Mesocestoides corti]|uniref:Mediator of RNA polymerase II transcription subunit 18 n=1 Tax=Mesocestoides corti TaxID=53468 RepID=A0A0R3U502_MESCO|nr:unnamed protein product [Mesocestoides corti]
MDGQYQMPGAAVLRKPPLQQQQQQQPPQMMMQPPAASLPPESFVYEAPEGQVPSSLMATSALIEQTRIDPSIAESLAMANNFTGPSSQSRGATMQETFIQGVVSVNQVEMLTTRLRGLCREYSPFYDHEEAFSVAVVSAQTTNPIASASGTTPYVQLRVRKSLLPNARDLGIWPVLRYLGAVESDDKVQLRGNCYNAPPPALYNMHVVICRRSYLEACVNGPLVGFLKSLGFKKDFEFLAEGEVYVRGRAKVLIYAVFEVVYPPGSDIHLLAPCKGRNVAPASLMVEVSAVGSPADETLQREVVDLMELLHPLVVPGRVDHARLACR